MMRDLFKSGIKKEAVQKYEQYLFLNIRSRNLLLFRWLGALSVISKFKYTRKGAKKCCIFDSLPKSLFVRSKCIAISHHSIYTQS